MYNSPDVESLPDDMVNNPSVALLAPFASHVAPVILLAGIARSLQRIENPDKSAGTPKTILAALDPKTESSCRVIPLPAHLLPLLKRFYSGKPSGYVIGENGCCVEPRTLRNRFQRVLAACGLPTINFHALRHSFATSCVENGMDIKSLSELLGHANVQIALNTYVHPSMEQKRRQLEQVANILGKNLGQERPKIVSAQGFARV